MFFFCKKNNYSCTDAACKKTGACQPGSAVLLFNSLSDVCVTNAATAGCDDIPCTSFLKGWEGRSCKRYTIDRPGRCNAAAACESDPLACSGLAGATHQRCGDMACRKVSKLFLF